MHGPRIENRRHYPRDKGCRRTRRSQGEIAYRREGCACALRKIANTNGTMTAATANAAEATLIKLKRRWRHAAFAPGRISLQRIQSVKPLASHVAKARGQGGNRACEEALRNSTARGRVETVRRGLRRNDQHRRLSMNSLTVDLPQWPKAPPTQVHATDSGYLLPVPVSQRDCTDRITRSTVKVNTTSQLMRYKWRKKNAAQDGQCQILRGPATPMVTHGVTTPMIRKKIKATAA